MFDQLKQLKDLRSQAKKMQETLATIVVEENDLDGKLKIMMNGNQEIISIKIDPELLTTDNQESLQGAIKQTFNKAKDTAQRQAAMQMQSDGSLPNIPGLS